MKKVLFVGGGSIGHIAPAVALAQGLKKHGEIDCYFVCSTNPAEIAFIKKYNFLYATLPNIRRYPLCALIQSHRILSHQKPDLIFSKGTSVSLPLCLVAYIKRIPIILHESDAVMGRANWLIAKLATCVCLGFTTGNPIREEITQGSREKGLKITQFSGQKPILLTLGGSQGAQALNQIVWNSMEKLLEIVDIAHITGPGKKCSMKNEEHYWCKEFAYDELPHLYAIADIALSRAGANTIAELDANGIPTILIPLRGVGHDHQYHNAKVMAEQNPLFIHIEQKEWGDKLISTIRALLKTPNEAKEASEANEAASKITKVILEHLEQHPGHP